MAERWPRRRGDHTRVFVYGTLRAMQCNHRLVADARFLGVDRTLASFTMFDLGGCPAVTLGGSTAIVGEVYEVDAAALARLDRLEGHPTVYERVPIRLASRRLAQLYLMPRGRTGPRPQIASGDWCLYRATGSAAARWPGRI